MKKIKNKKIIYELSGYEPGTMLELADTFVTAKSVVPDWYLKTPRHKLKDLDSVKNKKNIKYCTPFGDSFLTGYVAVTPCDVIIEKNSTENSVSIFTSLDATIFSPRDADGKGLMSYPDGCYRKDYTYKHQLHMKLPKGYSALVTHPLNRHDLPWITLSAVIDADKQILRPGNMPIFIKKNFEGIVPKGTPVFQVIPFKRESWEIKRESKLLESFAKQMYEVQSVTAGFYKKFGWSRKDYN